LNEDATRCNGEVYYLNLFLMERKEIMTEPEEKYFLNLTGEYAVCSELAKIKIKASLSFINKKVGNEVVLDDKQDVKLKLKITNKQSIVTHFFQKYITPDISHPDFWIMVFIENNLHIRFFILNHEELAQVQMKTNKVDKWSENKGGVDNIPLNAILEFENRWDKI
jgi:hypothetical protein